VSAVEQDTHLCGRWCKWGGAGWGAERNAQCAEQGKDRPPDERALENAAQSSNPCPFSALRRAFAQTGQLNFSHPTIAPHTKNGTNALPSKSPTNASVAVRDGNDIIVVPHTDKRLRARRLAQLCAFLRALSASAPFQFFLVHVVLPLSLNVGPCVSH